jgi:hypothetical protein
MATTYKLVDAAGTVLLDMTASPWAITAYQPQAPTKRMTQITDLNDGGEVGSDAYNNVSEGAAFLLADTKANIAAGLTTLERVFEMARSFQEKKSGTQVFVQFQADGGTVYRSEILTGNYQPGKDALDWQWVGSSIEVEISYTRRFYWEGVEAELTLTNGSGSNNGNSYLTIYNHDDSGANHDCFTDIAAAQVGGDFDTPIRLDLKMLTGSELGRLFIGIDKSGLAASKYFVLEAENGTENPTTADTASALASNGYYNSPTTNNAGGHVYWSWAPLSNIHLMGGKFYVVLARLFTAFGTGAPYNTMTMKVTCGSTSSPFVAVPTGQELFIAGVIQLPPYKLPAYTTLSSSSPEMSLILWFEHTPLTAGNVALDYIALLPIDCYRYSDDVYALTTNYRYIDDNISAAKSIYSVDTSGYYIYIGARYGNDLSLTPNVAQRIYILHENYTANATIAETMGVRAYYRPRRKMPI